MYYRPCDAMGVSVVTIRSVLIVVCTLGLQGCATQKERYTGLDKHSYGALTVYTDDDTHLPSAPPACDSTDRDFPTTDEPDSLAQFITRPLGSLEPIDQKLKDSGLQNNFKVYGDLTGGPTVAILDRSEDEITFWYYYKLVTMKEVVRAATTYCEHRPKPRVAVYDGSAKQCGNPITVNIPVSINGHTSSSTYVPTQVIANFKCIDPAVLAAQEEAAEADRAIRTDRDLIFSIQQELRRLGMLQGKADGSLGPRTRAAISAAQQRLGQRVDGRPSLGLLHALRTK